jgi:hypothetical protein
VATRAGKEHVTESLFPNHTEKAEAILKKLGR